MPGGAGALKFTTRRSRSAPKRKIRSKYPENKCTALLWQEIRYRFCSDDGAEKRLGAQHVAPLTRSWRFFSAVRTTFQNFQLLNETELDADGFLPYSRCLISDALMIALLLFFPGATI